DHRPPVLTGTAPGRGCGHRGWRACETGGMSEDYQTEGDYRIEHDSMGEVRVPAAAKWRAQTQRAVHNFPISGLRLERAHIAALARIKAAAARVNAELGVLAPEVAGAVAAAAEEVAAGRWDEQFPIH